MIQNSKKWQKLTYMYMYLYLHPLLLVASWVQRSEFTQLPCNYCVMCTRNNFYLPATLKSSSLVPRLSLSFSHFFARANFMREKSKESESLVWNLAHLWPPGHGLQLGTGGHMLHCPLYHSRTTFWTVLTSLTGNRGYLGESGFGLSFFF